MTTCVTCGAEVREGLIACTGLSPCFLTFLDKRKEEVHMHRQKALNLISTERDSQDVKWKARFSGDYPSTPGEKLTHLVEEVGEVARALNDGEGVERLRAELVQVAALCVRWLESTS